MKNLTKTMEIKMDGIIDSTFKWGGEEWNITETVRNEIYDELYVQVVENLDMEIDFQLSNFNSHGKKLNQ